MGPLTPVQQHGSYLLKRDDLFEYAGVHGAKARAAGLLALKARFLGLSGVVTAGSRHSPQVERVAAVAQHVGLECRAHIAHGPETDQTANAAHYGAMLIRHRPGRLSQIIAEARKDASERGWLEVPWGMLCREGLQQTARQVENLPWGSFRRLIVPVGSGATFAGILWGLADHNLLGAFPILGVQVGAKPHRRLDQWAPPGWQQLVGLQLADGAFGEAGDGIAGVDLDPGYEAKAAAYLEPGDLLWCVARRLPRIAA